MKAVHPGIFRRNNIVFKTPKKNNPFPNSKYKPLKYDTTPKESLEIGDEIWLAGKGKSLDTYDWSEAGKYRVGINETAFVIPKCWGAIALDSRVIKKYTKNLQRNITVFLKYTRFQSFLTDPFIYNPCEFNGTTIGTANAACSLFYWLGVRKINFIGFDSISGDANTAKQILDIDGKGSNGDGYKRINKALLEFMISHDDLEYTFAHDPHLDIKSLYTRKYANITNLNR